MFLTRSTTNQPQEKRFDFIQFIHHASDYNCKLILPLTHTAQFTSFVNVFLILHFFDNIIF